jgi:hypothetical protein
MKHLRIFENFKSLYRTIQDFDLVFSELEDFSEKERFIIKEEFEKILRFLMISISRYSLFEIEKVIEFSFEDEYFGDKDSISFYKKFDDYFYITESSHSFGNHGPVLSNVYYECDTIDGVLEYIQNLSKSKTH